MGLNLRGLGLAAGIALTVGVALYGVSKLAGGYVSFLAPVAPWMEANASAAWAWVQGNITLTLGMITGAIAGIKGFFTLLGSIRKQGSDLKDTVEEQVGAARTSFQGEIESVRKESETAIGELKGQVSTLQQEKVELQDKMNGQYEQIITAQEESKTAQLEAADLKTQLVEAQKRIAELQPPNLH